MRLLPVVTLVAVAGPSYASDDIHGQWLVRNFEQQQRQRFEREIFTAAHPTVSRPAQPPPRPSCRALRFDGSRARVVDGSTKVKMATDLSGETRFSVDVPGIDGPDADRIALVVLQARGGTVPRTFARQTPRTCRVCLAYAANSRSGDRKPIYFVVQGTTEAFVIKSSVVSYTFTDLVLAEWDIANERPVPGGSCLRADRLQLSGAP